MISAEKATTQEKDKAIEDTGDSKEMVMKGHPPYKPRLGMQNYWEFHAAWKVMKHRLRLRD